MAAKRKPLAERVTWEEEIPNWWSVTIGDITLEVHRHSGTGRFRMRCHPATQYERNGWRQLDLTDEDSAKREAIQVVQKFLTFAVKAWTD